MLLRLSKSRANTELGMSQLEQYDVCEAVPVHSSAPFGPVQSGCLRAAGVLVPALFDRSTPLLSRRSLLVADFPGNMSVDVDAIEREWETSDARIPLDLLCVTVSIKGSVLGLILRKLDTGERTRWGFYWMHHGSSCRGCYYIRQAGSEKSAPLKSESRTLSAKDSTLVFVR